VVRLLWLPVFSYPNEWTGLWTAIFAIGVLILVCRQFLSTSVVSDSWFSEYCQWGRPSVQYILFPSCSSLFQLVSLFSSIFASPGLRLLFYSLLANLTTRNYIKTSVDSNLSTLGGVNVINLTNRSGTHEAAAPRVNINKAHRLPYSSKLTTVPGDNFDGNSQE